MAEDELFIRIVDDPTDTVRFDTSVTTLQSDLSNGNFVGELKFFQMLLIHLFLIE